LGQIAYKRTSTFEVYIKFPIVLQALVLVAHDDHALGAASVRTVLVAACAARIRRGASMSQPSPLVDAGTTSTALREQQPSVMVCGRAQSVLSQQHRRAGSTRHQAAPHCDVRVQVIQYRGHHSG
jgi:hypothetical protein